ncbi:hypothetical protein [Streptomyces sp. NRRL S-340]|uniref:hypothetical protein n=1 Tax=Streptomyces sp. NRRL S-340 TaxID=1463901 RepID=UPI00055A0295|nr:hypothetical protein [Streptomyces sp. NRRL S-340]
MRALGGAAALLDASARPLVPRLAQLLTAPEKAPAAVLALLAVTGAVGLGRLAEAALRAAETGEDAAGAWEAVQALGAAALSARQRPRLTRIGEEGPAPRPLRTLGRPHPRGRTAARRRDRPGIPGPGRAD